KDFAPHRSELTRSFYNVAFQVSLLQFLIGPLVLITLPQVGLSIQLLVEIGLGATLAVGALYSLWRELRSTDDEIGGKFWTIVGLLWGTVLFMAHGRHLYREEALSAHRERVAAATRKFMNESEYAAATQNDAINKLPADQKAFTTRCSVCHAVDRVLAAPSVMEVAQLYKGNPKAIVAWAKAPGKKRAQFKGMPSMAHVPEDELFLIAEYMLRVGASPEAAAGAKTGSVSAGPAPEATAP
ncbi:MAG TPA: hypothetical protein VGE52_02795, partial [Pirellulales bacterium]